MNGYGYGLWAAAAINSAIFIIFAFSFFHPSSKRDWRAMGTYSAFVIALFVEMYGFPLTVYLLSGVLGERLGIALTHNGGHLWSTLLGWEGDPHLSPFHLLSYAAIGGGLWLISAAWKVLHAAHQKGGLATKGPYEKVRHPQYAGFILIMFGFLLQWPTIPTLVMFPIMVFVYLRLARSEEREVAERFGPDWARYASRTPRLIPRISKPEVPAPNSLPQPRRD